MLTERNSSMGNTFSFLCAVDGISLIPLSGYGLEKARLIHNEARFSLTDPHEVGKEEQREWFGNMIEDPTRQYYEIRDGQELVGVFKVTNIDRHNHSCMVGADISGEHRRKGYAKKTYELALNELFKIGFNRVSLCVLESNERARKLYSSLGFVKEGVLRQAVYRDGKYQNYIIMSVLKEQRKKRSICIVAGSPNLLEEELGEKIDSCDIVIRMNIFKIKGYEKHVGSKTNIAAYMFHPVRTANMFRLSGVMDIEGVKFWSTRPFDPKLDSRGKERRKSCLKHVGTDKVKVPSKKIWDHLINTVYKDYWRKQPSSGITVIEMAREEFPNAEIYICGFDETIDKAHYCTDHVDKSTPQNPSGHNWKGEYEYIQNLVKAGKIKHVRDKK